MGIRLLKINESVREIVSSELAGLKDPRVGFVTVTGVETSADLRHAKVFVSVLGKQREREASLEALRSAHGVLQARVAAALRMRRTPQLEFVYDPTIDTAMRVESLIRRYEGELGEEQPAGQEAADEHDAPAAVEDGDTEGASAFNGGDRADAADERRP